MDEERQPWDQQEGELGRWYQRFNAFRLMGPGRSVLSVYLAEWRKKHDKAEDSKKKQPTSPPGAWSVQSRADHWVDRAMAWDQHLADRAEAEIEEAWRKKIMGPNEVQGRLTEQGRVNIGMFFVQKQIPLRDENGSVLKDKDNNPIMVESWDIDMGAVKEHGHLVKSITATRYGPKIELYDGQAATIQMGKVHGLYKEKDGPVVNISFDLDDWKRQREERLRGVEGDGE